MIIFILLLIAGTITYFMDLNHAIIYALGLIFGGLITWKVIKRIGQLSKKSDFYHSLFRKLLSYRPSIRLPEVTTNNNDYNSLVDILKNQMNLTAQEAKDAAAHAMKSNGSLEEKLRLALKFHGG